MTSARMMLKTSTTEIMIRALTSPTTAPGAPAGLMTYPACPAPGQRGQQPVGNDSDSDFSSDDSEDSSDCDNDADSSSSDESDEGSDSELMEPPRWSRRRSAR